MVAIAGIIISPRCGSSRVSTMASAGTSKALIHLSEFVTTGAPLPRALIVMLADEGD